jgi:hypothetical protein
LKRNRVDGVNLEVRLDKVEKIKQKRSTAKRSKKALVNLAEFDKTAGRNPTQA